MMAKWKPKLKWSRDRRTCVESVAARHGLEIYVGRLTGGASWARWRGVVVESPHRGGPTRYAGPIRRTIDEARRDAEEGWFLLLAQMRRKK